jgi:hypothetical protein
MAQLIENKPRRRALIATLLHFCASRRRFVVSRQIPESETILTTFRISAHITSNRQKSRLFRMQNSQSIGAPENSGVSKPWLIETLTNTGRNALPTDYVTWSVSSKRIEREVHGVAYMRSRKLLMRLALIVIVTGGVIGGAMSAAASGAFGQTQKRLTNADVTSMTKQGLDPSLIVKDIEGSSSDFDISPQALIDLKNAGVDKSVMDAMLSAQARKPVAAVEVVHGAASPSDGAAADLGKPMCSDNGSCLLREGTQVPLKFLAELSSKTANEGDPVEFVLDDDLKVGDSVVVAKGAHALATVTNAKKAGMMGKGGELSVEIEYLIAGNNHVRMRGTKGREGDSKTGATVALTVLFGPIGLIKHGKNVDIAAGTPFVAYVDQNIWLALAK